MGLPKGGNGITKGWERDYQRVVISLGMTIGLHRDKSIDYQTKGFVVNPF